MTIDVTEIARLRDEVHKNALPAWILDVLDELEKARADQDAAVVERDTVRTDAADRLAEVIAERDENKWCKSKLIELQRQRDSAREVLLECKGYFWGTRNPLRARIAAELGDKP